MKTTNQKTMEKTEDLIRENFETIYLHAISPEAKRMMTELSDNLIRKNMVIMYPDFIDPEGINEVLPEEFLDTEETAYDMQKWHDEERAKAEKPSIIAEFKHDIAKIKENIGDYLAEHPTLRKGIAAASIGALLFLVLTSPVIMPTAVATGAVPNTSGLQANVYTVNNGIVGLVKEGKNYSADGVLNNSERINLMEHTNTTCGQMTTLDNLVKENGKLDKSIDKLVDSSTQLKSIADDKKGLTKAAPYFNNINATLAEINSMLNALNGTDNKTLQNTALSSEADALLLNISNFAKVYNVTLTNYNSSLGESVCYTLLKNLYEPADSTKTAREKLAAETAGLTTSLQKFKDSLAKDFISDGSHKSIDGTTYTSDAGALSGSIDYLEKDLKTAGNPWEVPPTPAPPRDYIAEIKYGAAHWPWVMVWWTPAMIATQYKLWKNASEASSDISNYRQRKAREAMDALGDDWDDECD